MIPRLYPHQEEALKSLSNGKILCGDVGSGKSITALMYYFRKIRVGTNLLIITTAKKRDSGEWEEELSRFPNNGQKVVVDSWNNIKKYQDLVGWFVIFDEQRLVGSGVWVKSFLKISKVNRWVLLSATPGDTWLDYIPVFVANGYYKNKTHFTTEHVKWKRFAKYPAVEGYIGTRKLERIRSELLVEMPFERHTVRHEKELVAQHDFDMMKSAMKNRWNPFEQEPVTDAGALCYLMRRISNSHPSRLALVQTVLVEKRKAIVFYNFDYELEQLRRLGDILGCEVREWNGHKHEAIPTSEFWVYLVQYTAGSEGWNCVTTDTVIFYSLNYSYRVMHQCKGRIDRLNTPYTDLYYYTIRSNGGIDLAIRRAIRSKKKFNERGFAKKLLE